MKWAAVGLILLDAAMTYIAVGYLGAHEVVLVFVNQIPSAIWLIAAAKVLAVLYIDKMTRRYTWAKYIISTAVFSHLLAVANNICWLTLYLLYFP